jgi:hypothetical protein
LRNIECFWYITSVDNLKSIFVNGILCRTVIEKCGIPVTDISDRLVQARRKDFHLYVPLFFADNTPMLHTVFKYKYETVCILEINNGVMETEGVKISNGNVACQNTEIYDSLEELTDEEWGIINSRSPAYSKEWMRIRAAEILVPGVVPVEYITSISVDKDEEPANPYDRTLSLVEEAGLDIPVNMNLTLYGVCQ